MNVRQNLAGWSLALSVGCAATPAGPLAVEAAGKPTISHDEPSGSSTKLRALWFDARQVLETRCAVCHGCYDAPCQLQLGSFEGIERGATKTQVYVGSRLRAIEPSRLFIDAHGIQAWRERAFFPVLPEGKVSDPHASLLVRMLELKREHPLALGGKLPAGFALGLDREQVCAEGDEFDELEKEHPLWGMPYALPGISDAEHETLVTWVVAGTPRVAQPKSSAEILSAVDRWEGFLNEPSLKGKLTARYMFEHLFQASLYFEDLDKRSFFRVVRSRTPSGQPIDEIATRRPFDDPGSASFYYRLRRQQTAVLAKTHMPYPLSDARLRRWEHLFRNPSYQVSELPSYDPQTSSNPFITFKALPVHARYRFMLEEAQFTLMGFIKGPVCRGQVALNVIEDRFWINFVDPESPLLQAETEFLATASDHLDLPAESGSNGHLVLWLKYARHQKMYLKAKGKFLIELARDNKVDLDVVWNGDGQNANAALTVLRHYDSATVAKGYVGGRPKTAWLLSYPLLERIHYLLVAGFDVFGNIGHQLNTRLYMDFLRMEAEHNFLLLLPRHHRRMMVERWYRDVPVDVKDQVYGKVARFDRQSAITYRSRQPEQELFAMLEARLSKVLDHRHDLSGFLDEAMRNPLERLNCLTAVAASYMPESSFVEVCEPGQPCAYFTISRDSAHTNVARVFGEDERRKPREDHLAVTRGFLGSYPNALFKVSRAELDAFVNQIAQLNGDPSYAALRDRFGVRRTDPRFWEVSDRMHLAYRTLEPVESGLFDFNRLEAN